MSSLVGFDYNSLYEMKERERMHVRNFSVSHSFNGDWSEDWLDLSEWVMWKKRWFWSISYYLVNESHWFNYYFWNVVIIMIFDEWFD